MRISVLSDYEDYDEWPTQVGYIGHIVINYWPEGMAAQTDYFYVGDIFLTVDNYETYGTLAATNTNTSASTIDLTGLEKERQYYAFGVRKRNSDGVVVAISNCGIVETIADDVMVTPATTSQVFNPATDSFFEWFHCQYNASHVRLRRMNDVDMGDFVRLDHTIDNQGYNIVGKKRVSPRYNWSLSFKIRHNGKGLDTAPGNTEQQYGLGFTSGTQAVNWCEYFAPHAGSADLSDIYGDTAPLPDGWDDKADVTLSSSGLDKSRHWATVYSGTVGNDPGRLWLVKPTATHPDYDNWTVPINEVFTMRYDYDAVGKTVKHYINDVLITTFGDTNTPLAYRRFYPDDLYSLPITPLITMQHMMVENESYVDIGEIVLETESPNEYAGWASCWGHEGDYWGISGDEGQWWMDTSVTDLDQMGFFFSSIYTGQFVANRSTVNIHSGYTLRPPSWDSTATLNYGTSYSWGSTRTEEFRMLPINVPEDKKAVKVDFQGVPRHGTLQAKLIDQDDNDLTEYADVVGVDGQAQIDIPENNASVVIPIFKIYYDGSAVASSSSPSLIVGASLELEQRVPSESLSSSPSSSPSASPSPSSSLSKSVSSSPSPSSSLSASTSDSPSSSPSLSSSLSTSLSSSPSISISNSVSDSPSISSSLSSSPSATVPPYTNLINLGTNDSAVLYHLNGVEAEIYTLSGIKQN